MLLGKGTKVKLKHTGDKGEVAKLLKDGMVSVYLYDDDMEIPVSVDDLIRGEEVIHKEKQPVKAKIIKGKSTPKAPQSPSRVEPEMQYSILKSLGLQLCFEPVWNNEGLTVYYKIWLINDLRNDYILSLKLTYSDNSEGITWDGKVDRISKTEIGQLPYDKLNDHPIFEIEKWRISTAGTEEHSQKTIKIKAKQFFSKIKTAPILNKPVHWYLMFEKTEKKVEKGEDLREYTKRNTGAFRPKSRADWGRYEQNNVFEFASFTPEIDLHIENLVGDVRKLDNKQIVMTQMTHFEDFMDNAIRVGVPRVFIIHGLGKGKLRDKIATRLMNMKDVKTFKNEYHERYGFGATEVIL